MQYLNEKRMPIRSIKEIIINIEEPMKMDVKIEKKNLALFVGTNGSGKTFILVNNFCLGLITHAIINDPKNAMMGAQEIYDKSFDNQNIDGEITGIYDNGCTIDLSFVKGKIVDLQYLNFEDIIEAPRVIYMSTNIRLFSNMSIYLTVRKLHEKVNSSQEYIVGKMLDTYKLYDVIYIEMLIAKLPFTFSAQMNETFKHYDFKEDFKEISVDLNTCNFYITEVSGKKTALNTYGNGHQSLINMFIGTWIGTT